MRAKNLLLTALLLGSLVAGAIAFTQMMSKGGATVPKEHILAATVPLPTGTLLRAQDVTWAPVSETEPDQIVHPSATAVEAKPEIVEETMTIVYGAVLRRPLAAGEPIRRGDFVKPGDRDFLQVVLTPGSRAIAIPVSTGGASTGLLQPGDRVDVVLTQNFKNDNAADMRNTPVTRRSVSETVVENLRVLAIDAPDTKASTIAANPANGNFGRTVTLEVTPAQVEQINVAAELGKLSVALRSITDPTTTVSRTDEGDQVVRSDHIVKPDEIVRPTDRVKPTWAGDVSPALYGAAQEKPIALTPPTVQVFHGAGREGGGGSNQPGQNIRSETVKTD